MQIPDWLARLTLTEEEREDLRLENALTRAEKALDRLERLQTREAPAPAQDSAAERYFSGAGISDPPSSLLPSVKKDDCTYRNTSRPAKIEKVSTKDIEKQRPLYCSRCRKEMMFSDRYRYDPHTGKQVFVRVDADCPAEGAFADPRTSKHDHLSWDGKAWGIGGENIVIYAGTTPAYQFVTNGATGAYVPYSSVSYTLSNFGQQTLKK